MRREYIREKSLKELETALATTPVRVTASADRLLNIEASERVAAPDGVWDLDRHRTWHRVVWSMISDFAGANVQKTFLRAPPEYLVSDDLSWLDSLVLKVHGHEIDSKHVLSDRLLQHYGAIRACHGTSTRSLDAFYEQGLRPLNIEEVHEMARRIFLNDQFPELSEANLQKAIEAVGPETREGHIYFEANEWFLKEMCGHYMLYGSEYLVALAAHLGRNRNYRRALKGRYPPTLLICDVPLKHLRPETVAEFAGMALQSVFQELLDGPTYEPSKWRGAAFSIQVPLDPSSIVGHCHPTITRDPQ